MGKGSKGGYSGTRGSAPPRSVRDNIPKLEQEFEHTASGLFGHPSDRKNSSARIIESDNPLATAHRFFDIGSKGGEIDNDIPGMTRSNFPDGTLITIREYSKSGSPAVEITIVKGDRPRKIHFERRHDHD